MSHVLRRSRLPARSVLLPTAEVSTGHPYRNDRTTVNRTFYIGCNTKRFVILSAKRERIRNSPLKEKRIAAHLSVPAMTKGARERIAARLTAVSPVGSVGASASQWCPPDTRTAMTGRQLIAHFIMVAMTKRFVILSAKRERIRNSLLKEKRIAAHLSVLAMTKGVWRTDCRAPNGGLACRLGRCFCFAVVSTGHPHRNDSFFVCSAL